MIDDPVVKECRECGGYYGFESREAAEADTEPRCWSCRCKIDALAAELGIPGNSVLAVRFRDLERRVAELEAKSE